MTDEQIEKAVYFCSSTENNGCLKECPCRSLQDNSTCDEIDYIIRLKRKISTLEGENDRLQGIIKQNDEVIWEMEEKISRQTAEKILQDLKDRSVWFMGWGGCDRDHFWEQFNEMCQSYGVEIKE